MSYCSTSPISSTQISKICLRSVIKYHIERIYLSFEYVSKYCLTINDKTTVVPFVWAFSSITLLAAISLSILGKPRHSIQLIEESKMKRNILE